MNTNSFVNTDISYIGRGIINDIGNNTLYENTLDTSKNNNATKRKMSIAKKHTKKLAPKMKLTK